MDISNVPCLTTALTGPLLSLEKLFLNKQAVIETWLRKQWRLTPPPLYSSVDLRNAGIKVAPIDTNLFSAGFNNLNLEFLPLAIQAMQATLNYHYPDCQRILLIPENHTRNLFYFASLEVLFSILKNAGYEVRIGSLREDLTKPELITLENGKTLLVEPIQREKDHIYVKDFIPCMIVLNNDLSAGIPELLKNIKQRIIPSPQLGWAKRLKSTHFKHYAAIAEEFAALLQIDPWFIAAQFRVCEAVDFVKREGEACLVEHVKILLGAIQQKYNEYKFKEAPYVVIKADAGTYGMGVLVVRSADELIQLNRKQRLEMAKTKGNQKITRVIIQEGVYTFEQIDQHATAEPVVYMIGSHVIGGFYRFHQHKSYSDNLNAPGMHFKPLAFNQCCNQPNQNVPTECVANRFYIYGVIARLAALAAAREIHEVLS